MSKREITIPNDRALYTHCTKCNYELEGDFDVCPKCGSKGHAVRVLKPS